MTQWELSSVGMVCWENNVIQGEDGKKQISRSEDGD